MTDLETDLSDTATEVIGYSASGGGTNSRPHSKSSNRPSSAAVSVNATQQQQSARHMGNSFDHSDSHTIMPSPRPGGQRAILEIASQMGPDDITEVIELLNLLRAQGAAIPSPYSNYSSTFPTPQGGYNHTPSSTSSPYLTNYPSAAAPTPSSNSYTSTYSSSQKHTTGGYNPHIPSPQGRRGKSGQTVNHMISEEDEEVTQHTNHNETYRLIPPAAPINVLAGSMSSSMSTLIHTSHTPSTVHGSHSTAKYNYRSGSATSNASGTNSASNSRSSTPIHKKSPVPITNQHDICPTVNREFHPNFSHRSNDSTPTPPRPLVIPEVPPLVLPRTERINNTTTPKNTTSSSKNSSSSTKQEKKNGRNALLDSLHSPRSAFDDCSLSSSSSNFTSASNRSGRSRGSSTVTGHTSTNSRQK
jgi:hypothetical protein